MQLICSMLFTKFTLVLWISLLSSFCFSTCNAQRWCKNLAMVGKWRICLRPSHMFCALPSNLEFFSAYIPRLSLIDAAVEIRSQLRKDKSVGKILDGKPEETHANALRLRLENLPHGPTSCQTWGSKIVLIPRRKWIFSFSSLFNPPFYHVFGLDTRLLLALIARQLLSIFQDWRLVVSLNMEWWTSKRSRLWWLTHCWMLRLVDYISAAFWNVGPQGWVVIKTIDSRKTLRFDHNPPQESVKIMRHPPHH